MFYPFFICIRFIRSEYFSINWKHNDDNEFLVLTYGNYDYYFKYHSKENTTFIPQGSIRDICISNDGHYIAYTTANDMLYIYDCRKESHILNKHIYGCYSLNFNQTNDQIGIVDGFGTIISIYKIKPFEKLIEINIDEDQSYNYYVKTEICFSKNNNYVMTNNMWGWFDIYHLPTKNHKLHIYNGGKDVYYSESMDAFITESDNKQVAYKFSPELSRTSYPVDTIDFIHHSIYGYGGSTKATSDNGEYYVELSKGEYIKYGREPSIFLFKKIFKDILEK